MEFGGDIGKCDFLQAMVEQHGESFVQGFLQSMGETAIGEMRTAHESVGVSIEAMPEQEEAAAPVPVTLVLEPAKAQVKAPLLMQEIRTPASNPREPTLELETPHVPAVIPSETLSLSAELVEPRIPVLLKEQPPLQPIIVAETAQTTHVVLTNLTQPAAEAIVLEAQPFLRLQPVPIKTLTIEAHETNDQSRVEPVMQTIVTPEGQGLGPKDLSEADIPIRSSESIRMPLETNELGTYRYEPPESERLVSLQVIDELLQIFEAQEVAFITTPESITDAPLEASVVESEQGSLPIESFSEYLQAIVSTAIEPSRQIIASELISSVYEQIATALAQLPPELQDPAIAGLTSDETLVTTIVELLQEFGLEEPPETLVSCCIMHVQRELHDQIKTPTSILPPDIFHERITGVQASAQSLTMTTMLHLRHRLLARLVLRGHFPLLTHGLAVSHTELSFG